VCDNTPSSSATNASHINHLVNGLFYLAAFWNDAEAHALLAYRYEHGIGGIEKDIETAVQYCILPVRKANEAYHTVGAQPIVEADRIHEQAITYYVFCICYDDNP